MNYMVPDEPASISNWLDWCLYLVRENARLEAEVEELRKSRVAEQKEVG